MICLLYLSTVQSVAQLCLPVPGYILIFVATSVRYCTTSREHTCHVKYVDRVQGVWAGGNCSLRPPGPCLTSLMSNVCHGYVRKWRRKIPVAGQLAQQRCGGYFVTMVAKILHMHTWPGTLHHVSAWPDRFKKILVQSLPSFLAEKTKIPLDGRHILSS